MPTPSQLADLGEQLAGQRVALAGGLGDQRAGEVARVAPDPRRAGRTRPGLPAAISSRASRTRALPRGVLLPAAAVAALAAVAVGHDLHVAELARDAEPAADDAPVEHDARRRCRCRG